MGIEHVMQRMGVIGAMMIAAGIPAGIAQASLIGEWEFDNNLLETSGFKPAGTHDGEAVGTISFSTDTPLGRGGASLDLTNGSSAVRVINSNAKIGGSQNLGDNLTYQSTYDADIAAGPMTISVWVKGWPDTWEGFVSEKGESGNGYQLRKFNDTNHAAFTLRGTGGNDDPQGGINVNDGQWHQLTGVWDSANGNRYLYVDGVLDTAGSITDGSDTGSVAAATYEYVVFGGRDNGGSINSFAQVKLDDVRIYNEALTQSQIAATAGRNLTNSEKIADSLGGAGSASGIRFQQFASGSGALGSIDQGEGLLSGELFHPGGQAAAGSVSTINYTNSAGTPGLIAGTANYPGGSSDNMATQWAGVLDIQTAGQYVFGVNSDDGFRLTIGGKVVSEFVGPTGGSDQRVGITFDEAGLYRFELTQYNGGGGNNLEFWAKQGTDNTVGPLVGDTANGGIAVYQNVLTSSENLGSAIATGTGVKTVSEHDVQKSGFTVNSLYEVGQMLDGTVTPTLDRGHARTNISGVGVPSGFNGDNFGVAFTGVMNITSPGQYTFSTASDDGFRLIIGGTVVSEANYPKGTNAITNTANFLEAGVYEYQLLWFEKSGGEGMTFTAQDALSNNVEFYGLAGDDNTIDRQRNGFVVKAVQLAAGQLGGSLGDLNEANDLLDFPTIYGSTRAKDYYATLNLLDGGSDANYGGGVAPPITGDNYALEATGAVHILTAGFYTFGMNGDDGYSLAIGGNVVLERFGTGGPGNVLATVFFKTAGWYDLDVIMFESGVGSEFELFAAEGAFTAFNSTDFHLVGDVANRGLEVMTVPTPAALPAGLALLSVVAMRRRS
ncbi:MAG: hypothetical protein GC162_07635 [Planctomycetes bacterium]|nr:hypothetical protein [Planctomycetota bacterium]